jgi:hypothetical protein
MPVSAKVEKNDHLLRDCEIRLRGRRWAGRGRPIAEPTRPMGTPTIPAPGLQS